MASSHSCSKIQNNVGIVSSTVFQSNWRIVAISQVEGFNCDFIVWMLGGGYFIFVVTVDFVGG